MPILDSTSGTTTPHVAFPDTYSALDPDRPAIVMAGSGRTVSYRELVNASREIANLLWGRGLRHGDCVAILMDNSDAFLKVAWALQRIGLRYVGLATRMQPSEIAYVLDDSAAQALFTSPSLVDTAAAAVGAASGVRWKFIAGNAVSGFESIDSAVEAAEQVDYVEAEGVDLLYSSGTTGRPKGVVAGLALAPLGSPPGVATLLHQRWGIDEHTVYLSPAPLYHAAPLRFCMTVHRFGGTVVVMERFDAEVALELIERHAVTHSTMVPTMLIRMLKLEPARRNAHDLSSLEVLIHAAAPMPEQAKRDLIDWLGPIVHEFYSSTENYLFTALDSAEWLAHPGSVGRSLSGKPHVLDDRGAEVPAGQTGTVWSEGGLAFEYLHDPDKTAQSRNDRGWTTVGDLGYLDEEGYLYLSERRVDLILSGGVNVYPQEAENLLLGHPDVADAAVFGIPHDELGEIVHAVVQPSETRSPGADFENELLAYVNERLARYKCPRRVDFADALPRLATGKLLRRVLRDHYRTTNVGN